MPLVVWLPAVPGVPPVAEVPPTSDVLSAEDAPPAEEIPPAPPMDAPPLALDLPPAPPTTPVAPPVPVPASDAATMLLVAEYDEQPATANVKAIFVRRNEMKRSDMRVYLPAVVNGLRREARRRAIVQQIEASKAIHELLSAPELPQLLAFLAPRFGAVGAAARAPRLLNSRSP